MNTTMDRECVTVEDLDVLMDSIMAKVAEAEEIQREMEARCYGRH